MIDRDGAEMQIVCDSTGERYRRTYDRDDFDRMIADAKDDGWRVILERGRWRHYCPGAAASGMDLSGVLDLG